VWQFQIGYLIAMTNNAVTAIRLHELVIENGRSASPFVWRVRYALAHKGLEFESVRLGFTEIPGRFEGKFKTVPVLECGDTTMAESWDIVEHLDRQFPERPALFSSPAELATVRLVDSWFTTEVMRRMFRVYVKDLHDCIRPADREYFRSSRERNMKGATLETFTADRAALLPVIRSALNPLRTHLTKSAWIGGGSPNFADYIVFSAFQWVASCSTLPLLAADDPLRDYLDRGFGLYGGIGREAPLQPLFE
jgi:glutathione S-transferase